MIDMGLEVGKTYVDGYGEKHTIVYYLSGNIPFQSDVGRRFSHQGIYSYSDFELRYNLVSEYIE